jgi:hypothetical protein
VVRYLRIMAQVDANVGTLDGEVDVAKAFGRLGGSQTRVLNERVSARSGDRCFIGRR